MPAASRGLPGGGSGIASAASTDSSPWTSAVQVRIPPPRSRTPYGLSSSGNAPAGSGWQKPGRESFILAKVASKRSPHGKRRSSTPRAAFSHSASVGSR